MAGERTYPILPCPDLDEAIAFYAALGFAPTYRQLRPNPYAVLAREDMTIHLSGIDGFDPATSVSSVIVVVPDADALYASFAEGLRAHCGRLPSAGVPRILRPRRKQGTATGFSVVDVGGNWLRFYRGGTDGDDGDRDGRGTGPAGAPASTGLVRVLEVAARQGDARGDHAQALAVLERGLLRHPQAANADVVRVLTYRAELLVRTGDLQAARAALEHAERLPVPQAEAAAIAGDLAHAREVLEGGG